jgi:hypothetical protein
MYKWACNYWLKHETGRLVTFEELVSNERMHKIISKCIGVMYIYSFCWLH